MAYTDYSSFNDYLKYLQNPPAEDSNIKELTQTTGSTDTSNGTSPTTTTAVPTSPTEQTTTNTVANTYSVKPSTTGGSLSQRIMAPAQQELGTQGSNLQNIINQFSTAAGKPRTYETAGIQNYLQQAIQPGSSEAQKAAAKGYLSSAYTGPTELSKDEEAAISKALTDLLTYAKATKSPREIATLASQAIPGSTPGEQVQETQALVGNKGYFAQQKALEDAISSMISRNTAASTAAQKFAKTRAEQEAEIASKSRAYLTGQESAITGDLQAKLAQAQADYDKMTTAINAFKEKGTLPPGAEGLQSEYDKGLAEAQAKWDEIIAKYPEIASVPIMQLVTDRYANRTTELPEEYVATDAYNEMVNKPNWDEELSKQVYQRQTELEKYFSPYDIWEGGTLPSNYELTPPLEAGAEGIYSKYKPMYFGAVDPNVLDTEIPTWQSPSRELYMVPDEGMSPTMANIASAQQREIYNNINNILGEVDNLEQTDPYRAASVVANVKQYLDDEAANLAQWDELPTESAKEWLAMVQDARDRIHDYQFAGVPFAQSFSSAGLASWAQGDWAAGLGGIIRDVTQSSTQDRAYALDPLHDPNEGVDVVPIEDMPITKQTTK